MLDEVVVAEFLCVGGGDDDITGVDFDLVLCIASGCDVPFDTLEGEATVGILGLHFANVGEAVGGVDGGDITAAIEMNGKGGRLMEGGVGGGVSSGVTGGDIASGVSTGDFVGELGGDWVVGESVGVSGKPIGNTSVGIITDGRRTGTGFCAGVSVLELGWLSGMEAELLRDVEIWSGGRDEKDCLRAIWVDGWVESGEEGTGVLGAELAGVLVEEEGALLFVGKSARRTGQPESCNEVACPPCGVGVFENGLPEGDAGIGMDEEGLG